MNKSTEYAIKWQNATNKKDKDDAFTNLHYLSTHWYREAWKFFRFTREAVYQEFKNECALCLQKALTTFDPTMGYTFNTHLVWKLRNAGLSYLESLPSVKLPRTKGSKDSHFVMVIKHLGGLRSLTPVIRGNQRAKCSIDYLDTLDQRTEFSCQEYCNPFNMLDTLSHAQRVAIEAQYGEKGAMGRVEFMELKTGYTREWTRQTSIKAIKKLRKLFKNDMEVLGYEV